MSPFIAHRLGHGLLAHLVNAFLISAQVLLCLIALSPLLYRFTLGKNEGWLWPWTWMTSEMLVRLGVVGGVMTLCFGVGSWIIARHEPSKKA